MFAASAGAATDTTGLAASSVAAAAPSASTTTPSFPPISPLTSAAASDAADAATTLSDATAVPDAATSFARGLVAPAEPVGGQLAAAASAAVAPWGTAARALLGPSLPVDDGLP